MTDTHKEIFSEKLTNTFIWTFKKGDNIIYNVDILWALYEAKKHYIGNKNLYNKPITIIIVSIIECILEDFVRRIQDHSSDPLPNITPEIVEDFKWERRGGKTEIKRLEKFCHYIDMSKKHKIFGLDKEIYKTLDSLRNIRNAMHIQKSEINEYEIFTNENLKNAEGVLEKIVEAMVLKYPRWGKEQSIDDIPYPWKEM